MIHASTRILSSVYARHSDRMSVGIFLRGNGLRGRYPPPVGAGIAPASGAATITRIIYHKGAHLVIVGVILALLIYIIDTIPIFKPFRQVARTIIIVIGVLILILL